MSDPRDDRLDPAAKELIRRYMLSLVAVPAAIGLILGYLAKGWFEAEARASAAESRAQAEEARKDADDARTSSLRAKDTAELAAKEANSILDGLRRSASAIAENPEFRRNVIEELRESREVLIASSTDKLPLQNGLATLAFKRVEPGSAEFSKNYDPGTGAFTAPWDGYFLICCAVAAQTDEPLPPGEAIHIEVARNGTRVAIRWVRGNGSASSHSLSLCEVVQCRKGDSVVLQVSGGARGTVLGQGDYTRMFLMAM
jgi:hypothetical protein